jgi:hypothetical protein
VAGRREETDTLDTLSSPRTPRKFTDYGVLTSSQSLMLASSASHSTVCQPPSALSSSSVPSAHNHSAGKTIFREPIAAEAVASPGSNHLIIGSHDATGVGNGDGKRDGTVHGIYENVQSNGSSGHRRDETEIAPASPPRRAAVAPPRRTHTRVMSVLSPSSHGDSPPDSGTDYPGPEPTFSSPETPRRLSGQDTREVTQYAGSNASRQMLTSYEKKRELAYTVIPKTDDCEEASIVPLMLHNAHVPPPAVIESSFLGRLADQLRIKILSIATVSHSLSTQSGEASMGVGAGRSSSNNSISTAATSAERRRRKFANLHSANPTLSPDRDGVQAHDACLYDDEFFEAMDGHCPRQTPDTRLFPRNKANHTTPPASPRSNKSPPVCAVQPQHPGAGFAHSVGPESEDRMRVSLASPRHLRDRERYLAREREKNAERVRVATLLAQTMDEHSHDHLQPVLAGEIPVLPRILPGTPSPPGSGTAPAKSPRTPRVLQVERLRFNDFDDLVNVMPVTPRVLGDEVKKSPPGLDLEEGGFLPQKSPNVAVDDRA